MLKSTYEKSKYENNKSSLSFIIGQRIRFLRTEKNLPQFRMAMELYVSDSTYNQWERGSRVPSVYHLAYLANYFQVTTDYLLGLSDKRN